MDEFDWDDGNAPKIEQRYSIEEVEFALIFENPVLVRTDEVDGEVRRRVASLTQDGERITIVYTLRKVRGGIKIRPLSAFPTTSAWEVRAFEKGHPRAPLP